jgi:hypothetical protein
MTPVLAAYKINFWKVPSPNTTLNSSKKFKFETGVSELALNLKRHKKEQNLMIK